MTPADFSALYEKHRSRMIFLARRMGIPEMDCEDVVQNAFMGLLKSKYENIYVGLVVLATVRGSFDWIRANKRRLEQTIYIEEIDKHDEDGREELLCRLELILSARGLTMRDRAVFIGLLDGETYREIGGRLGVSKERVRQIRAAMLEKIQSSACLLPGSYD